MTARHDIPFLDGSTEFSASLLGEGLPAEAGRHLHLAAVHYRFDDIAETHLAEAQTFAPDHAAVLIGRYRYHFYKGQLLRALEIAHLCLRKAARELALPEDWRHVHPGMARFGAYEEMGPRFFLFALKGYAYLHMRLGNLAEGRLALEKLLELDKTDKIGAHVLLDVILRAEASDDD